MKAFEDKKRVLTAISITFSLTCSLWAPALADDNILRLDALLKEAMERNPRIVAVKKTAEAAWVRASQARAWDDPLVYIGRQPGDMQMVGVEQMFPFPGKLSLKGRIAGTEAEALDQIRDRTILEVLVEVKHAFHHIFHWHKKIEINMENQDILKKFIKVAESRYLVGKAGQEDVLKANVEAGKLSNELILLNQMKKSEEANLIRLLDRPLETVLPPPEPLLPPSAFSVNEGDLYAIAEENRQEIRAAQAAVRAGEASRSLTRLAYAPDFVVKAEWWRVNRSFEPFGENWAGMVGIRVPLWFFQKQNYGVKEADIALDSARADLKEIENRVRYEVRDSFLKVKAAKAQLEIFNAGLIPQAEQALRVATGSYQAGTQGFLTLLDSQRVLMELKLSYYDALVNFYMTLADLELAIGKELTGLK